MNPESIKTRISIGKQKQGDIAFIYDFNLLEQLNVAPDAILTNCHSLSIDSEFKFNEKEYKVIEINPIVYDKTKDMANPPGVNIYGIGEPLDYNFEIILFVEEI
jgi:hypothetical protein